MRTIGFIGLGVMGLPIARRLAGAGDLALVSMARTRRRELEELRRLGAQERATPGDIAAEADVVLVCVKGSPEVEDIVEGTDGLLAGLRPGLVIVDLSTGRPDVTRRLADRVAARGGRMADAALGGGPAQAVEGMLTLLVGADEATLTALRPLLERFAKRIVHAGLAGAGHALKLINNAILLGYGALYAEAVAACEAVGLSPALLYDVVTGGVLDTPVFRDMVGGHLAGEHGFDFRIGYAEKDLRYYLDMLHDVPAAAPVGHATHEAFVLAAAAGMGERKVSALIDRVRALNTPGPRR